MSTEPSAVTKVARDLTEIVGLQERLMVQAINKAGAQIDGHSLPGGAAMVNLAGVADRETNERRVELHEEKHLRTCLRLDHSRCWTGSEDEDDTEPVLQTLLFWSEQWRTEHGFPLEGRRPTIATESNLIRSLLDWAWSELVEWEDFARDVSQARVRLENLLHAGRRQERSRIVCDRDSDLHRDGSSPRLIRIYGEAGDGSEDRWKCPGCKARLDDEEARQAHAKMLRSQGAERWVHQADAISTLKAQGRSENTVRSWLGRCQAEAYCDPITHQVYVWWPSLWRLHLTAPAAGRRVRSADEEPVA